MTSRRKKNAIGPNIRKWRLGQKPPLSQADLAARLEVRGLAIDRSALARIEVQDRSISDVEIKAIAEVLRVPIQILFEKVD